MQQTSATVDKKISVPCKTTYNVPYALFALTIMSFLSWHLAESPFLRLADNRAAHMYALGFQWFMNPWDPYTEAGVK